MKPLMDNRPWKPSKHALDVLWASDGRCHICGEIINVAKGDRFEVEHVIPKGIGGAKRGTNERAAHVHCHRGKTSVDRKVIAKCNRIARKREGTWKTRNTLTHRTLKRKVNGKVVPRHDD